MYKIGFSGEKYLEIQSEKIMERVNQYDKLYLEFGGKIFNDMHGSRVIPGFDPNMKISLMQKLGDKVEIVLAINATDIEQGRIQSDSNLNYGEHLMGMINKLKSFNLYVSSVVITQFVEKPSTIKFMNQLNLMGVAVYKHYIIDEYPTNINLIMSDDGFGMNEYIETTRQLVVVAAAGAGSGKMATCMSQLYHEFKRGKRASYAKFEKFPVWNLPINHPINLAYEAATTNIMDQNMIDPFHLEAYGESAVNYNRDIEAFPILNAMFKQIWGYSPYKSPTDMGVNMIKECIIDEDVCKEASKQEIIRRYFGLLCDDYLHGGKRREIHKVEYLMAIAGITDADRKIVSVANMKKEMTKGNAIAMELASGEVVTGKTTATMTASASIILNALKTVAGITDSVDLISSNVMEPIRKLNSQMGEENYLLKASDVLIALSISSVTNPTAELALTKLSSLRNGQAHSTTILNRESLQTFKTLGIDITCKPSY